MDSVKNHTRKYIFIHPSATIASVDFSWPFCAVFDTLISRKKEEGYTCDLPDDIGSRL